jgi:maltooligosyltrehalose trehalohydrolase
VPLEPSGRGYFEGIVAVDHGADYLVVLDGGRERLPDPCSRHQPHGLRGPSRVFDPGRHRWRSAPLGPPDLDDLVIYELHVGAFTTEGTFDAAAGELERLRTLGVGAVELMPVAEFPGARGWGYDGVYLSSAHHAYGGPAGLQRFVDAAHAAGIAVILDVVYNHFGTSGTAAIEAFGPYLTGRYRTLWGNAVNFDDAGSDAVRDWVLQSAVSWLGDFRIDGLRLDAVHAIFDQRPRHVVGELCDRVHAEHPGALVIAESALNDARVIRPPMDGGWGCDAQWADDFHHALHALLTGERDGYYAEFGKVADLAKAFVRPFVRDGDYSSVRDRRVGAPAFDRPPCQFVVFAQNHDQVGNRAFGDRLDRELLPLAAFATLLSGFLPMIFMGEEYGELAPFRFFTDHIDPDVARATGEGRREEFAAFAAFGEEVPDPQDASTFTASHLSRDGDPAIARLYPQLIAARRLLRGEALDVAFDEEAGWLRVTRAGGALCMNFSVERRSVPVDGAELLLGTASGIELRDAGVELPPRAGALVR